MTIAFRGLLGAAGAGEAPEPATGYSVLFNGSDEYASRADEAALDVTGSFTLEAWIRKTTLTSDERAIIDRNAPSDFGLLVLALNSNKVWFHFYTGTTFQQVLGSTEIPEDTWVHVAGIYNGSTAKVYVNGVEDGSANVAGAVGTGSASITIARSNRFGRYFNGNIIDARYWGTSRAGNLGASITGEESDLVFAYDRDVQPGSGSSLIDKGPNGFDMALVNAPTWSPDLPT